MRRLLYLLPLVLCLGIGLFFYRALDLNPRDLPSALINMPAPEFTLPALPGRNIKRADDGLALADLTTGKPVIVNVWASWCIPCVAEHPLVDRMAKREGVTVHGINYRDKPAAAAAWLKKLGDPYAKIGQDESGRVSIDWGVYGVPETYVVDGDGVILYRHAGALSPEILENFILPLVKDGG